MRPFLVMILIISSQWMHSQCTLEGPFIVNDFDVLKLELDITGLQNGDLGSGSQGVCGIAIEFEHERVGNLLIEVESPSGQVITLVGPNAPFGLTNFTHWDISFVPCGSSASPDGGFSPFWTNQNNWQNFGNYNGSYYPFLGCLEDLNVGSANGTWTFTVRDAYLFDEGVIEQITLFFCDPTGVDCEYCYAGMVDFQEESKLICESDLPYQNIPYDWSGLLDSSNYRLAFLAVEQDTILQILDSPEINYLSDGQYDLCGLSYDKMDSIELFSFLDTGAMITDILDSIEAGDLCAIISESCLPVTIQAVPDTIYRDTSICIGDTISLNGVVITGPGLYSMTDTSGICDQLIKYTVSLIELNAEVVEIDTLSCGKDTVLLEANDSGFDPDTKISWYRENQLIAEDTSRISVSDTGHFKLVLAKGNCSDTMEFQIIGDFGAPSFDLNDYDTLDCNNDGVEVYPLNTDALNWLWITPQWDTIYSDTLTAVTGGNYVFFAEGGNGCINSDTFRLIGSSSIANLSIDTTVNVCGVDTILLRTLGSRNGLIYNWEGPDGFLANSADTFTFTEGTYFLSVTDTATTCETMDSFAFFIESPIDTPLIFSDTISCQQQEVQLRLDTVDTAHAYVWITPMKDSLLSVEPFVTGEGIYSLILSKDENCYIELSHTVQRSLDLPEYSILGDTLECSDTATILRIVLDQPDTSYSYEWIDPLGNVTAGDSTIAKIAGTYKVRFRVGGFCELLDSFSLTENFSTFDHLLSTDTLNCLDSIANLSISGPDTLSYVWQSPDGSLDTGKSISTSQTGSFLVTINDGDCQYRRGVVVTEDKALPDVMFEVMQINCLNDSAELQFTSMDSFSTYLYNSDSSAYFELSAQNYRTAFPGEKRFRFIGENGCRLDTILTIEVDTLIPDYQITLSDTLNCNVKEIEAKIEAERSIQNISWYQNGDTISLTDSAAIKDASEVLLSLQFENGCITDSIITISQDTLAPSIEFDLLPITCSRPQYELTVSSGQKIDSLQVREPNNDLTVFESSFTITQSGEYFVRAFAKNGCSVDTAFFISADTSLPTLEFSNDTVSCGEEVTLIEINTDTGALDSTFWIKERGGVAQGLSVELPVGLHHLILIGNNGCVDTLPKEVVADRYIANVSGIPDSIILTCDMPDMVIQPDVTSKHDSVNWYRDSVKIGDSLSLQISEAGMYYLELSRNNCKDTIFTRVIMDTIPPTIDLMGDSLGCRNPSTALFFQSNEDVRSILWEGPDGFLDSSVRPIIVDTGLYIVQVTDSSGCMNQDSIYIGGDFTPPQYNLPDTFYRNCSSGLASVYINTDEVNTVNWFAENQRISESDSFQTEIIRKVIVIVEGKNGCRVSDSAWIAPEFKRPEAVWQKPVLDCNNREDIINLIWSNGVIEYSWEGPNGFSSDAPSPIIDTGGVYRVNLENIYDCTSAYTLDIEQKNTVIRLDLEASEILRCRDSTTHVLLSTNRSLNDTIISWRSIEGQILDSMDPLEVLVRGPGVFEVVVEDPVDMCITKDTIQLQMESAVDFPLNSIVKELICEDDDGGEVVLITPDTSRAPYLYQQDNSTLTDSPIFSGLPAGLFRFTVYDKQFCEKELLIEIDEQFENTIVDLGPDREEEAGSEALVVPEVFVDQIFIDSIHWLVNGTVTCKGCDSITVFLEKPKLVEIRVYTNGGCVHSDQMIIEVPTDDVLFIPNVFSPNEDGNNDFFYIQTALEINEIELLEIYERNGNRVFEVQNFPPNDLTYAWDGTFAGQALTPQVLAVRIIYTYEGERKIVHHDLTLIR